MKRSLVISSSSLAVVLSALTILGIFCSSVWVSFSAARVDNKQRTSYGPDTKIVLLHYHKTGHDLCRILSAFGYHQWFVKIKDTETLWDTLSSSSNTSNATVLVTSGLDLRQLTTTAVAEVRWIHFVRDPFDWCLSAYLYHHQRPVPSLEQTWITHRDKDRCRNRHHARDLKEVGIEKESLENVSKLCHSISNETGLWQQLQQLNTWDGLCLEAARGLLGASHGDLIKMARNMKVLKKQARNGNVIQVTLSQFTSSEASFQTTAMRLCRFAQGVLSWGVQECAESFFRHGWLGKEGSPRDPQHVTADKLSNEERQEMHERLNNHPVLGNPLRRVQDIVRKDSTKI